MYGIVFSFLWDCEPGNKLWKKKYSARTLFCRYLQSVDLSGGSAFELPHFHKIPNKDDYETFIRQNLPDTKNNPQESLENTIYLTRGCHIDDEGSHYLEISSAGRADAQSSFVTPFTATCNTEPSGLYFMGAAQENQVPNQDFTVKLHSHQLEYYKCSSEVNSKDENYTQIENHTNVNYESHNELCEKLPQICKNNGEVKDRERTKSLPDVKDTLVPSTSTKKAQSLENLDASLSGNISHSPLLTHSSPSSVQSQFDEQKATAEVTRNSALQPHYGMVVAIDNSNIYIGAQECASMVNPGDRKRHVRVKLQNLVRILEKDRTKTRGFACGSSPPATEHVWEVYRYKHLSRNACCNKMVKIHCQFCLADFFFTKICLKLPIHEHSLSLMKFCQTK